MANPVSAIVSAGASLIGSSMQSRAARSAARQQTAAADAAVEEQRRQYEEMRQLLEPYTQAGPPALEAQQGLIGLRGPEEQQRAISQIEQSPLLQALTRQGEEAILQRASATGGLRGGNVQGALAQFRPAMLQEALDTQFQRLGGLTELGQRSATGVGAQGVAVGQQIGNLMTQRGQAQAGGTLAAAAPFVSAFGMPAQIAAYDFARGGKGLGSIFGG